MKKRLLITYMMLLVCTGMFAQGISKQDIHKAVSSGLLNNEKFINSMGEEMLDQEKTFEYELSKPSKIKIAKLWVADNIRFRAIDADFYDDDLQTYIINYCYACNDSVQYKLKIKLDGTKLTVQFLNLRDRENNRLNSGSESANNFVKYGTKRLADSLKDYLENF